MNNLPDGAISPSVTCLPPSFDWVGFQQVLGSFSTPDFARGYQMIDQRALALCLKVLDHYELFRNQPPIETMESLTEKIRFVPRARYLLERMMTLLTEENYLSYSGDSWTALRSFESLDQGQIEFSLDAPTLSVDPIFEFFARVEENLFAFFSGRKIGPGIIFDKGDKSFWDRLNNDSIFFAPYAKLAAFVVSSCLPHEARVLEIGAGTGAATARLLEINTRPSISKYLYTDVSTVFLDKGRNRFGDHSFIEFKVYDLNKPPQAQGLGEEVFDVILGVNALHVARDIPQSLRFLQALLKPSGRLIIGEGSPPDAYRMWRPDLLFGILDGWWNVVTDPILRPQPGWLQSSRWKALLKQAGFESICALPPEGYFGRVSYGGVIVGQAPIRSEAQLVS
jgi:SAM-dependent methyltransferase